MTRANSIPLSVVISTWNRRDLVWQAIDSVIGQQYEGPLEIVVVDDGSTDGTMQELSAKYCSRALPANRRLVIHANPHTGITGTIAKGIELSSGSHVAQCNSDDLWEPVRAAEMLAEVEKTPNVLIHANAKDRMLGGFQHRDYTENDDHLNLNARTPVEYPGNVTPRELLLGQLRPGLTFCGGLTVFPRRFMQGEFAMPAGLWHEEVWYLFAGIMQGGIRFANRNSCIYRVHGKNECLPEMRAGRELEKIQRRLVFLEHALPILRNRAGRDEELLRRVETHARVVNYRLGINAGASLPRALAGLTLTDFLVEPRGILSHTLSAKAPSLHRFQLRMRQRMTRSSHGQ
jgi:glycosyltransferase involved in cell wall biosynthesis